MKNNVLLFAIAIILLSTTSQSQNVFPETGFVGIGTDDPEAPLELGDAYDYMIFSGFKRFGTPPGTSNFTFGFLTFEECIASESNGNIAFGNSSQRYNTTGDYNISFAGSSLINNTTGSYNIALGLYSAAYLTAGDYNIAMGRFALFGDNGTGFQYASDNIAIGESSLRTNGLGNENIAIGKKAMYNNLKGSYNTSLGCNSMNNNIKGNYNTALGYLADVAGVGYTNATVIGYNALVDASNKVRIGNVSVSSNGGQVSWTAYSDARIKTKVKENVPGLEFINLLKPVTYHFDVDKQNELMGVTSNEKVEGMYDIEKISFTGFLAQDVDAAAQQLNYDFSGLDKSGEILGLRYAEFVVPLVKAVQELDAENTALESRITQLEQLITKQGIVLSDATSEETYKQSAIIENENQSASLAQNVPNPFTGRTSIAYYVPEQAHQAHIKIANATGASLFMAEVRLGNGVLEVDATQLNTGTYSYTLLVDGKVIDTKLMVIQ